MSPTATVAPPGRRLRSLLGNGIVAAVYVLLFAIFARWQRDALSLSSLTDLCNNALPLALAAAGGALVVLTRGFDLSMAGVVAPSDVLVATQVRDGLGGVLAGLAIVMAVGLLVGAVNVLLVAYVRLQSLASTLATMIVERAAQPFLDLHQHRIGDLADQVR